MKSYRIMHPVCMDQRKISLTIFAVLFYSAVGAQSRDCDTVNSGETEQKIRNLSKKLHELTAMSFIDTTVRYKILFKEHHSKTDSA